MTHLPANALFPPITVVIIAYNSGSDRLSRVLAALAAQTFLPTDVVVFDNASTDGAIDSLILPKSLPVTIIRHGQNAGFAGGVMEALPHVTTDWAALLNPDAYPAPGWLAALARGAATYGNRAVLGSIQRSEEDPSVLDGLGDVYHIGGIAWRGGFGHETSTAPQTDKEIFGACFAAVAFHKGWFEELGGLDRDFFCYHEDVDFGFRNRLRGGRAVLLHDAVVDHEGSGTTGRYSDFTVYHGIRNRHWTFWKNMPLALMPLALPQHVGLTAVLFIYACRRKIAKPYLRGVRDGFGDIIGQWKKRPKSAGKRKVSLRTLMKFFTWSPRAISRRSPQFWPPEPDAVAPAGAADPAETPLPSKPSQSS